MSERVIQYPVAQVEKVQRADKLFADHFESISRSRLQRAFEAGRVTFNGQVIDKRYKVQQPGLLEATLEEVAADAARTRRYTAGCGLRRCFDSGY